MRALGLGLDLGGGLTAVQAALGRWPGVQFYAGIPGSIYYGKPTFYPSASDVFDNLPVGQPTSSGLLVDGSDAPTLVQGRGPELASLANMDKRVGTDGTLSFVGGVLRFENAAVGLSTAVSERMQNLTVGATYELTSRVRLVSGSPVNTQIRNSDGGGGSSFAYTSTTSSSTFVTQTLTWIATQADAYVAVLASNGSVFEVESISFRQVLPFLGATGATGPFTQATTISGVPTDAVDRTVWRWNSNTANDYLILWREGSTGDYRLESFVGGVTQGHIAFAGANDGGTHLFIASVNQDTNAMSLLVDGGVLDTALAADMPSEFISEDLGHNGGADQLGSRVREIALANGVHWQLP